MTELLIQVLVWIPVLIFNGWVTIKMYHVNNRRLEKKFLRHLKIEHPDSIITISAVETSDREALNKIKEQLDVLS